MPVSRKKQQKLNSSLEKESNRRNFNLQRKNKYGKHAQQLFEQTNVKGISV
jgi:hypothetical protein